MNLCELVINAYAENRQSNDRYIEMVCAQIYSKLKDKCVGNARAGLVSARIEVSNSELDKLDGLDEDQKQAYISKIKQKLSSMINAPSGQKFSSSFTHIITKKKNSRKKTRACVNVAWKPTNKQQNIRKSNMNIYCCICMEVKPGMSLQCGHLFCESCSDNMLSKPCPICRTICTMIHPLYQS